jgi:predicted membrane-bound spermidine synthase
VTLTTAVLGTAVLQHDQPAIEPFIAIGLGLVVLAAVERSTRFTTITAGYLVVLCVSAAFTPVEGVDPSTWSLGSVVVLPGLVLVVGGLVGLRRE